MVLKGEIVPPAGQFECVSYVGRVPTCLIFRPLPILGFDNGLAALLPHPRLRGRRQRRRDNGIRRQQPLPPCAVVIKGHADAARDKIWSHVRQGHVRDSAKLVNRRSESHFQILIPPARYPSPV